MKLVLCLLLAACSIGLVVGVDQVEDVRRQLPTNANMNMQLGQMPQQQSARMNPMMQPSPSSSSDEQPSLDDIMTEERNVRIYMNFLQQLQDQMQDQTVINEPGEQMQPVARLMKKNKKSILDEEDTDMPTASELTEEIQNVNDYWNYLEQLRQQVESNPDNSMMMKQRMKLGQSQTIQRPSLRTQFQTSMVDMEDMNMDMDQVPDQPADDMPTIAELNQEEALVNRYLDLLSQLRQRVESGETSTAQSPLPTLAEIAAEEKSSRAYLQEIQQMKQQIQQIPMVRQHTRVGVPVVRPRQPINWQQQPAMMANPGLVQQQPIMQQPNTAFMTQAEPNQQVSSIHPINTQTHSHTLNDHPRTIFLPDRSCIFPSAADCSEVIDPNDLLVSPAFAATDATTPSDVFSSLHPSHQMNQFDWSQQQQPINQQPFLSFQQLQQYMNQQPQQPIMDQTNNWQQQQSQMILNWMNQQQ